MISPVLLAALVAASPPPSAPAHAPMQAATDRSASVASATYLERHARPTSGPGASSAPTATLHAAALGARGIPVQLPAIAASPSTPGTAPGQGCAAFSNGTFFNDLHAWTATSSAATPPAGAVTVQSGVAVFEEGRSFLTSLTQSFCVPAGARELRFDLVAMGFDTSATFLPDAFEVSLLNASLQSVVPTWSQAATSFFNVQESGMQLFGSNVTVTTTGTDTTVALDLTGLTEGELVLLTFDLIGADADFAGTVSIDEVFVDDGGPGYVYCEGVGCPCGNDSPGSGCATSLGHGGRLGARGSTSIAADDLVLEVRDITTSFGLLFGGTVETCVPVGDGLLGLQPGILPIDLLRLGIQQASGTGQMDFGPGLVARIDLAGGAMGIVTVGSSWSFQVAYRDAPASPCGRLFNYTNPIRVTFTN